MVKVARRGGLVHRGGSRPTHGETRGGKSTRLYNSWCAMRQRCLDPNSQNYQYYGGRGITICKQWDSFEQFRRDVGEPPDPSYKLERRDTNGPYSPQNCYWATHTQQTRNQRSNVVLTYNGKSQCMSAWAEELGMPYDTLRHRIDL